MAWLEKAQADALAALFWGRMRVWKDQLLMGEDTATEMGDWRPGRKETGWELWQLG